MLSREQAQALARVAHLLRPAWNEEGIYAALAQVKERPPFDVALATLRAAADDKARTPGVIPTTGPHWNELAPTTPSKPKMSRAEQRARTCETCGRLDGCTPPAHDFVPLDRAKEGRTLSTEDARAELAAIKAATCRHHLDRRRGRCAECDRSDQPSAATETKESA